MTVKTEFIIINILYLLNYLFRTIIFIYLFSYMYNDHGIFTFSKMNFFPGINIMLE